MRKFFFTAIALSFLLVNSASARSLGKLDIDKTPRNLWKVSEFENFLKTTDSAQDQAVTNGDQNSLWWGGYGYGSYYYPSYYYPYYGYGYYGWYLNEQDGSSTSSATANTRVDAAHSPVVCFASDSSGNWFADADIALNVGQTQQKVNNECNAANGSCLTDVGCAFAYGDN